MFDDIDSVMVNCEIYVMCMCVCDIWCKWGWCVCVLGLVMWDIYVILQKAHIKWHY